MLPSPSLRRGAFAWLIFVIVSCRSSDRGDVVAGADEVMQARELARREISARTGVGAQRILSSEMTAVSETSAVIPGLVVYRVVHEPHGTAHMQSVALVATHQGRTWPVRTLDDLSLLTEGLTPTDSNRAIDSCGDLVRWGSRAAHYLRAPEIFEGPDFWRRSGWTTSQPVEGGRAHIPRAERIEGARWRVTMWFAEPGRLALYECRLAPGARAELVALDSLPGLGLVPEVP